MSINTVKTGVCGVIGALGGLVATLFGGWGADLTTLVIFMAIDFVTGLVVAAVFHKSRKTESGALESRAGLKGLCRKGAILLVVLVAHRLDVTIGIDAVRTTVVIGFIANEAISIFENFGLMGVPFPAAIKKALDILTDKADAGPQTPEKKGN